MAGQVADTVNETTVNGFSSNWRKLKASLDSTNKNSQDGMTKKEYGGRKRQRRNGQKRKLKRRKDQKCDTSATEGSSKETGPRLTKVLAMDCEYVGVGEDGEDHMVARVSLVNAYGECVYDKFVKPTESVTDYRTAISGIREENIVNGHPFDVVQHEINDMIHGRILVGHSIHNDFKVLYLSHPKRGIRDTSRYRPFRAIARTKYPSLKKLCRLVLGIEIQEGEHDSVCDARATMQLYQLHKRQWETTLRSRKTINQSKAHSAGTGGDERKRPKDRRIRRRGNSDDKNGNVSGKSGGKVSSHGRNESLNRWRK